MPWTSETMTTPRLSLRACTDADPSVIVELMTNEDVRRYLGGPVATPMGTAVGRVVGADTWGVFCVADSTNDNVIGPALGRPR